MTPAVTTPEEYLNGLPENCRADVMKLRNAVVENLPPGFEETRGYGMLAYVVPRGIYPAGYHTDPKLPLPFVSIAAQKKNIALYHMGLYAIPSLLQWFTERYINQTASKPDIGKSCVRLKSLQLYLTT